MKVYYNEWDDFAATWLENLIAAGHLPAGDVDRRSVTEVRPDDLKGYTQCHFFAGLGGWPYALRLAGWPDDRPVWSASLPCQPFSVAGVGDGTDDTRHLWPEWFRLVAACRPSIIFGEQVASALVIGLARANGKGSVGGTSGSPETSVGAVWLDGIFADLEGAGYTCGAAIMGAHSVGAPHIRQRLFWVAHPGCRELQSQRQQVGGTSGTREGEGPERQWIRADVGDGLAARGLADTDHERHGAERDGAGRRGEPERMCGLGHADVEGLPERAGNGRIQRRTGGAPQGQVADGASHWSGAVWLPCLDGKARRIEPRIEPLVDGLPGRVGRLRAYGNAIVPQVAAEFIRAYREALSSYLLG